MFDKGNFQPYWMRKKSLSGVFTGKREHTNEIVNFRPHSSVLFEVFSAMIIQCIGVVIRHYLIQRRDHLVTAMAHDVTLVWTGTKAIYWERTGLARCSPRKHRISGQAASGVQESSASKCFWGRRWDREVSAGRPQYSGDYVFKGPGRPGASRSSFHRHAATGGRAECPPPANNSRFM